MLSVVMSAAWNSRHGLGWFFLLAACVAAPDLPCFPCLVASPAASPRNKSFVRDMRWTPGGEKICIAYDDGAVIVGRWVHTAQPKSNWVACMGHGRVKTGFAVWCQLCSCHAMH